MKLWRSRARLSDGVVDSRRAILCRAGVSFKHEVAEV
jgi:hypothetical protein